MKSKLTLEEIKNVWTARAEEHTNSHKASWSDKYAIELETQAIGKYLREGERILDIGCANGYSTLQYGIQKNISIRGIDYIPEMIEQAMRNKEAVANFLLGTVDFKVDNVLNFHEKNETYEKVVATRVIINLGDWENQAKGLSECMRVLKPKGMFLLSEATLQGWTSLNKFRREWHLPDIPMPEFNNYMDKAQVVKYLASHAELIDIINFSSTYYVGTRILKPLIIKALNQEIDVSLPEMEWNRLFSLLPSFGDYGVQELFIFQKR
ncbi:class I SAM-dependent methyltransferase [Thermodesulfobacteriota bacterium]